MGLGQSKHAEVIESWKERRAASKAALEASGADLEALKSSVKGTVLAVTDEDATAFDGARTRPWNFDGRGFPSIIVRVSCKEDVAAAVSFAQKNSIELAVASGAHSCKAMVDKTLCIDFFEMKNVEVDETTKIVKVDSGCRLGDVDDVLRPHGLAVPWGTNPYTGVAGLTLSGGGGFLGRKYGLTVDNLVAVDAILMDGTLIHATEDNEHADFLWACKGGGGSFGIIVHFHFQSHKLPSDYLVGRYSTVYLAPTMSSQRGIIENYAAFMKTADASITNAMALPCGAPVVPITWAKVDNGIEKGQKLPGDLKPCGNLGGWLKVENKYEVIEYYNPEGKKPWKSSLQHTLVPHQQDGYYYEGAVAIRELNAEAISILQKYTRVITPNSLSAVICFPFGCAIKESGKKGDVLEEQRKAAAWIIIEGKWAEKSGKAGREKVREWVRALKGELEKLPGTMETSHSLTSAIESDNLGETQKIFCAQQERLTAVKTRYDINNVLKHNRNIAVAK